jgi:hypothetical protein
MAVEILDIIDTGVKVGLGALISGITTYFVTTKNQKYELKKISLMDKVDLLRRAAVDFEESSSITHHACTSYIDYINGYETKKIEEIINNLTEASNMVKNSKTNFYLVGNKDLANLCENYWDSICDLRDAVRQKDKEVDIIGDKLNKIKKDYLEILLGALDDVKA